MAFGFAGTSVDSAKIETPPTVSERIFNSIVMMPPSDTERIFNSVAMMPPSDTERNFDFA